jgi:hypothetical protein
MTEVERVTAAGPVVIIAVVPDPIIAAVIDTAGYNPLALFALEPRYASQPQRALDEFRDAVKALHASSCDNRRRP